MRGTIRLNLAWIAILPLAISLSGTARASRLDDLAAGTRLRVTMAPPGSPRLIGSFLDLVADSALRIEAGRPIAVPLAGIDRVEQSIGSHRHTKLGGLIGFGIGVAVGASIHAHSDPDAFLTPSDHDLDIQLKRIAVALGGLGIGALVGHSVKSDIWEDVEKPIAGRSR